MQSSERTNSNPRSSIDEERFLGHHTKDARRNRRTKFQQKRKRLADRDDDLSWN